MAGLAADDASERHHPVIRVPLPLGRIDRDRDRRRDFQRSRYAHAIEGSARLLEGAGCTLQQHVGNVVVETRLDHQQARIGQPSFGVGGTGTRFGHGGLPSTHRH
jgi:hypothetical protein